MSPVEQGLADMVNKGLIPTSDLRISRESTDLMTNTIIDSINNTVGADDTLVIAGDFCWTSRDNSFNDAKAFRDRINCRNLILILGNHDNRKTLTPLFSAVYDQYTFNIDGQSIFINHYPMRSWDKAHYGCWNLYGHIHSLCTPEDNGELMPYEKMVFSEGFANVFEKHGISNKKIINDLLAVVASTKGIDLTLDIGVDNIREGVPFGTPWSMSDLHDYFGKKKNRWLARQKAYKELASLSSLKSNPKI